MAERRMFAKTIIDSDAFLDMPMSARLLYYDLGMRADDDGFINAPKKIMRTIGATSDDMNILIARKFVIPFDSGVVVIKAWRINNYLRSDRYKETNYLEEKEMLDVEKTGMYTMKDDCGIPLGIPLVDAGKDSIVKDSIVKDNNKRFTPPTLEEVRAYCQERNNTVDPEKFIDFYESKGWLVGKNKMKDWKASVRTWERNRKKESTPYETYKKTISAGYDFEALERELREGK